MERILLSAIILPDTNGTPAFRPKSERRSAGRFPCHAEGAGAMVVSDRHESRWAYPRDISTTGIGLTISGSFATGALALLESAGGGHGDLTLLAQVVHCSSRPDGSWSVGCRFNNIRSDLQLAARQQLQTLLRQAPADEHGVNGNAQQIRAALRTVCDNPLHDLLHSLKRPTICSSDRGQRPDHLYDVLLATTDNLHLHRRPVKLASLITRTLEFVRTHAQGPTPRLSLSLPLEPVSLNADVIRLEWALARLILAVVHRSTRQAPVALTAALVGGDVSMRIGGPATYIDLAKLPSTADLVSSRPPATDNLALSWDDVELALARQTIELHGGGVQIRRQKGGRGSHISLRLRLLAGNCS
jgi:hypothetical protein